MNSATPFEDPRITDLRGRIEAAIETAGHDLVSEPVPIEPPADAGLKGKLKGHCQSLDSAQERFLYYAKIDGGTPLSGFLENSARACQSIPTCQFYVVVTESSTVLEKSCRSAGAGLLCLSEENTFELVVSPDEYSQQAKHEEILDAVRSLRRRLETKYQLNESALKERFSEVDALTASMAPEMRDEYIQGIHSALDQWSEWYENVGSKLDDAAGRDDKDELSSAEKLLEAGALIDDGDES